MRRKILGKLRDVAAIFHRLCYERKEFHYVTLCQRERCLRKLRGRRSAKHILGILGRNTSCTKDRKLLEHRNSIAQATVGILRHQLKGLLSVAKMLSIANLSEALDDVLGRDGAKIKTLDARQNRRKNFLWIGCTQNKNNVRRWLFKGLEQGIKGLRSEHVNFIDDVYLVAALNGGIAHVVNNFVANGVNTRARCSVELIHIGVIACSNKLTLLARAIRKALVRGRAEQRFC